MTIDGVEMVFQMAPETEAPSEMLFYLPQFRTLHLAELASHFQHNILTLRGSKARSAFMWARAIDAALIAWGRLEEKNEKLKIYPIFVGDISDASIFCHTWSPTLSGNRIQ
jgi:alkyl sulfatase BDS1-like metallo-beta-lactamase superfamily hydrolase